MPVGVVYFLKIIDIKNRNGVLVLVFGFVSLHYVFKETPVEKPRQQIVVAAVCEFFRCIVQFKEIQV